MTNALIFCENVFGKLSVSAIAKIEAFISRPTEKNWDDIARIIIRKKGLKTIWQSVLEVEPSFTRQGRHYNESGKVVKKWDEIPSPETVKKAIALQIMPTQPELN